MADKQNLDGVVWVRRTYPKRTGPEAEFYTERWYPTKEDSVPDVLPAGAGELARVKVGLGMTINLGNYESARVDVGVELPCRVAEVNDAFGLAWEAAEHEVRQQIRSVRGGGEGGSRG